MNKLLIIVLVLVAMGAGFYLQTTLNNQQTTEVPEQKPLKPSASSLVGQLRPDFTLPDLEDKRHNVSEWDGKVLLVNFWATWCPPCKREFPAFIAMREKYKNQGFEVIGIAIDNKDAVQDFVDTMGAEYPILHGEMDTLELSRAWGNRLGVLPYSVFVGKDGRVISTHNGEVTEDMIEGILHKQL